MKKKLSVDQMLMKMELPNEVPPGSSLIEIVGNHRVFVENQVGVCSYSRSSITVKVRQGAVCIVGENLELKQMTRSHLVITGVIFGVTLTDWR